MINHELRTATDKKLLTEDTTIGPARLFFLDNLRAVVIILVLVLHGSMTYMAYAPEWWYVVDPSQSLFFTSVVLLADVPIMLILFFVSGYFAYPSLAKRGPGQFWRDKFIRVGLPWIFGVLVLAPPTAYMIYYSRNVPVSLWDFWRTDFWGPLYQQSVYWFLGILLLLFTLLAVAYRLSDRLRRLRPTTTIPSWQLFAGFGGLMTAGFLLMNQFYPLDTWTHIYLLMFQPLRTPLYAGYFLFGLIAYQQRWFTEGGYRPGLWRWLPLFLVSGLLYLGYRFTIPTPLQTTLLLKAGNAVLFNTFCLSALMAGAAFFQRHVNSDGPLWRSLARNSYAIYYIHPLILYPLALGFVPLSISIFLKAALIIGLALLLCWAISALLLTRLPGLRRVF